MQHGQNARLHLSGNAHPAAARERGPQKEHRGEREPSGRGMQVPGRHFPAARTCPFPGAVGKSRGEKRGPQKKRRGVRGPSGRGMQVPGRHFPGGTDLPFPRRGWKCRGETRPRRESAAAGRTGHNKKAGPGGGRPFWHMRRHANYLSCSMAA